MAFLVNPYIYQRPLIFLITFILTIISVLPSINPMKFSLVLLFASFIFLHGTTGEILCEDLTKDNCSFAISSSGKRCVLEDFEDKKGKVEYQCRTSEVVVEILSEYIETDACVSACGVDRNATGISSDALLDKKSIVTLCSPACYQKCPNIIDLHSNLALGEGVSLPDLCEQQRSDPDCNMIDLLSSSAANGPIGSGTHRLFSAAPAPFSF
ncbi:hypothetical protein L1887_04976 [Cichorium endivia]|nr:hypothetical protein L1887_04976 [Cichorium endivia]